MRLRFLAAAAGCALLLAPSVAAQSRGSGVAAQPRVFTTDEIAADAAYGFCPLFLANSFSLTAPELAERGFSPNIVKQQNPRFGEIQTVTAKRADGEIAFGGRSGMVCTVVVSGDKRVATFARLHVALSWMGLDFKPVPHAGPALADVTVRTFKAAVKGQFLIVQLMDVGGPTPSVIAQLFATAE